MSLLSKIETAHILSHPEFAVLPKDSDGNPCVYQNDYECDNSHDLQCWSDSWSCSCDDHCPVCGTACAPVESTWIGPASVDLQVLWLRHFGESAAPLPAPDTISPPAFKEAS